MRRGIIRERADVNYAATSSQIEQFYSGTKYPLTPLVDVALRLQYGTSALASEEKIGTAILRMNNLQDDGWDLSSLKYIALTESEAKTYQLVPGDLLFNRTNSKELVGKCAVFREAGDWAFASYLIRVSLDDTKALPDFVADFLSTKAGRMQIDRVSRQIVGMSNINAEEIKQLVIPLPPLSVQQELVAAMQAARARRAAKLQAADAEIAGIDAFLLEQLGLMPPPADDKPIFAMRFSEMTNNSAKRCDYDFHSPHFQVLLNGIANSTYGAAALGTICESFTTGFAAGRENQADGVEESVPHVRPFNISPQGEFTLETIKSVPRSSVQETDFLVQGEVLFNNTNSSQWVGKTAVFDSKTPCVCSNHITRLQVDKEVAEPSFVAEVLNALRGYGIFGILATNFNNQAGVNTQTLSEFQIPLPPLGQQQRIAEDVALRRAKARGLREEAGREWEQAKAEFERRLLGGVS